jgi:8-oxo-dGTP pyrophosphatase MutT (NUDIX family)
MTRKFGFPTYPPAAWDERLSGPVCEELGPPQLLHENPWFKVCKRANYYTVEYRSPQVVILPLIGSHSSVMVRAKRPVIADAPFELPAGTGEAGEAPAAIAARELHEETGIRVTDLARFRALAPLAVSSARMPKLAYVFRIDLSQEEFDRRGDHDDEIELVESVPLAEVARRLASGEIYVAVPAAIVGRHLAERQMAPAR